MPVSGEFMPESHDNLGDATDKPLLEKQAARTDRRLRVAAGSALKRLGQGAQQEDGA